MSLTEFDEKLTAAVVQMINAVKGKIIPLRACRAPPPPMRAMG